MSIVLFLLSSASIFSNPELVQQFQDGHRINVIPPDMWAHEQAGISYDENSRLNFGRLDNGMRFAIGKTAGDDQRCKVSLLVSVGSKEERPEESGMAHFLEHMVFRNSDNFPDSKLNQMLTDSIYGESNKTIDARTSSSSTYYTVSLAYCSESELHESLKILGDIAFRAQFRPEDVKKEAQIIDGEHSKWLHQISRKPGGYEELMVNRKIRDLTSKLWPSFGFPHPAGSSEIRNSFTVESLDSFYRRWYIPAHMAIVYVGPHESETVQRQFVAEFADFKSKDIPTSPRTHTIETARSVFSMPAIMPRQMQIHFEDISALLTQNRFDEESLRKELVYLVVADILQESLDTAAFESHFSFAATIKLVTSANGSRFFNLVINTKENHEKAVLQSFAALNRFNQTGFENKLEHAKKKLVNYFASRKVPDSAPEMMKAIFSDFIHSELIWPEQPTWFADALNAITQESCHDAYLKGFLHPREREGFFAIGLPQTGVNLEELLSKAKTIVDMETSTTQDPPSVFAYNDIPGTEFDKIKLEIISCNGQSQTMLKNGPTIWSCSTSRENQIGVMMFFGETTDYSQIPSSLDILTMNDLQIPKGHSLEEIKKLFPNIFVKILPVGQSMVICGYAPPDKLDDLLKYIRAILVNPDYSYLTSEEYKSSMQQAMNHHYLVNNALLGDFIRRILGTAPHINAIQLSKSFLKTSPEELEAIMQTKVAQGITRIGFVGPLDFTKAVSSFAQIFRNFQWRSSQEPAPAIALNNRRLHSLDDSLDSDCRAARVLVLFPLKEKIKPEQRSDFEAIAHGLEKAIFTQLRVGMGEGYAPAVLVYDNQGIVSDFIFVDLWASVDNSTMVAEKIEEIAVNLADSFTDNDRAEAIQKARKRYTGGNSPFLSFLNGKPHQCRKDKSFNRNILSSTEELKQLMNTIFINGGSSSMLYFAK